MVTTEDTGDRATAHELLGQVTDVHRHLEPAWADGGHTGSLIAYCLTTLATFERAVLESGSGRSCGCAVRTRYLTRLPTMGPITPLCDLMELRCT